MRRLKPSTLRSKGKGVDQFNYKIVIITNELKVSLVTIQKHVMLHYFFYPNMFLESEVWTILEFALTRCTSPI